MARKSYKIDFGINSSAGEAAARRIAAALGNIDKAAQKASANATTSANKAAEAQASSAKRSSKAQTDAIQKVNVSLQQLQLSGIKFQQSQEKAAARMAKLQEQASQKAQREADKFAAQQDRATQKALKDAERAAAQQDRIRIRDEKAAARKTAADERAVQKSIKDAERLAASQERARAREEKAAERKAAQEARRQAKEQASAERAAQKQLKDAERGAAQQERIRAREIAAIERKAAAEERRRVKELTDEQVLQKAREKIIRENNRQRVAEASGIKGEFESFTEMAVAGNKKMGIAIAATQAGIQGIITLLNTAGKAFTDAGNKSREMTRNFNQQRDDLGELASVMDVPLDNKFTLDFAKFNAQTGFKPSEGKDFLTEIYNSGAQYVGEGKGKHISDDQFEKFKVMVGQFAVQTHIDPKIVGDLAGNILGSTDFSQHGDKAAQEALAVLNSTYQTGKRGRGENATLLQQFIKSASLMLREDREQGIMSSAPEVMAGISVLAERNPEDAETFLRRGTQGLRAINDKKAGPLLEKAGISKGGKLMVSNPFEAAKLLGPIVREEAKKRGGQAKVADILNESFDERESAGIAALMEGVEKGTVKDRLDYAKKFASPEVAINMLQEQQGSEAWRSRQADAENTLAEMERGAKNSKLDVIRRQAAAKLMREGWSGTNTANLKNYLIEKSSFGVLGQDDQLDIDEETQRLLKEVAPAGTKGGSIWDNFNFTPTAREEDLNRQIGRIEEAGGDPVKSIGLLSEEMKKTNNLLQQQLDLLKKPPAGNVQPMQVAPAPPTLIGAQ